MKNGNKKKEQLRRQLARAYERVAETEFVTSGKDGIEKDSLRESTRSMRSSRKMEIVSQLAETLAQYFNNILTLIIGYGTFLHTRLAESDPLRPYVRQILVSSERAALLTRSLLAYSRNQVMNPEPVGINEIVKRAGKLMQRIIGEGIEFKMNLSRIELPVSADPVQLEQVMMNLVTNARDAMPHGGILTIETKLVEMDNLSAANGGDPWKCAMISFSDTGTGMNSEVRQRIFEPFYTTKEPGTATGLGLSIVHGIVKQHNGCINVTTDPGKGTRLSIFLPLLHRAPLTNRVEPLTAAFSESNCYYS
ncbi:MAG: Blue-light-activated protein [Syntrophorhabdaceae bacterium PtaU1.Bin034]|jgi:signal transduction histidine kinase|nr:MAG: Blue-light-activated protein [Syntrophorhabdaceae bacterium PtaU1.Bin034]